MYSTGPCNTGLGKDGAAIDGRKQAVKWPCDLCVYSCSKNMKLFVSSWCANTKHVAALNIISRHLTDFKSMAEIWLFR